MTTHELIEVRALARVFKTRTGPLEAVKGIDFDVRAGEIVGLLGPNGAGKTTTLRMLTTLLLPSSGSAAVAGFDVAREPRQVRRNIGYVAQVGAAPSPGLRVGEELVAQARLHGLGKAEALARVARIAPRLDLGGLERRALVELSGGQRRRFDVALGLMHEPRMLFLDEPTAGLDPQSRANLWTHIRSLRDEAGVTIVLTTHYLDEADALADRILVMDGGQIVANDTPDALKARISGDVITLGLTAPAARKEAEVIVREALPAREVVSTDSALLVTVEDGATAIAPILRALDAAGLGPSSITVNRPSLDDVFLTLTGRTLRDQEAAA